MASSVFISSNAGVFSGQQTGPAASNVAAPPFTFLGDLTSGYGSSAAGTLDLITAGVSRLSINSASASFLSGAMTLTSAGTQTLTAANGVQNLVINPTNGATTFTNVAALSFTSSNDINFYGGANNATWNVLGDQTVSGITGTSSNWTARFRNTWNTSGTPSLIYAEVTDTSSNAASKLLRLDNDTVGGTVFGVRKNGLIDTYKFVATAGWGVPAIYASGEALAQTALVASVATYTVGAADGMFEIHCNVNVTTSTTHNFGVVVTYTDETNAARSLTMPVVQLTGTVVTAITNVTGAGPYEGVVCVIKCKASTAITITTAGTFTNVVYNVKGAIAQLA